MGHGAATSARWAALAGAGLGALAACRSPGPSIAPEASASSVRMDDPDDSTAARPRPPASASARPATSASASAAAAASGSAGPCVIRVVALQEAAVFAGPGPDSPSRQRAMERLSPAVRDQWRGRDHAYTHLLCRYTVSMNGRLFHHAHVAGQQLGSGRTLDTARCSSAEVQRALEAQLVQTTKGCSDPHAGAYWGADLGEMAP